jgi:hypothetical protein
MSSQSSESTPYTQRVEVGAYYTDGADLWRVVTVSELGCVDLINESTGRQRLLGIDSFRRLMWRAR